MSVRSKRSKEGYYMLDHRASPGLTEFHTWVDKLPPGSGSSLFEAPTFTCSHCIRIVVMEPARTRDREHCFGCHHDICDECGVIYAKTRVCCSFKRMAESSLEAAAQESNIKEL